MKRRAAWLLATAGFALVLSCTTSPGQPFGSDTGPADATDPGDVGADTGFNDSATDTGEGWADGAVQFQFPASIDPDTLGITVRPAHDAPQDPLLVPGTAFDFGPDGLDFGDTVYLVIAFDPAMLAPATPRFSLRLGKVVDGVWQVVPASTYLKDQDAVVGPITGFSTYGVLSTGQEASLETPQISEVLPPQGQPGDMITVKGVYLDRTPRELQVVFGRADNVASPQSNTDFRAEVQVPAAIQASSMPRLLPVHLKNGTKQSGAVWFTLWDPPPEPPMITAIQPLIGSPGDPIRINAVRVAPTAEGNRVQFNGIDAPVEFIEFIAWTGDTYRLNVRVPQGATTGPIRIGRVIDGIWSSESQDFKVQAAVVPTLTAGWETGPVTVPCMLLHRGQPDEWSICTPSTLVLGGSGFNSLRYREITALYPHGFYGQLLVRFTAHDDTSVTLLGSALTDELLIVDMHGPSRDPEGHWTSHEFFSRRAPGEIVRVVAWGKELDSENERYTNQIELVMGEPLVTWGARFLATSLKVQPPRDDLEIAQGDHLCLEGTGEEYPYLEMKAPGLWTGVLPFAKYMSGVNPQALTGRCFRLDTPGDLVLTNLTSGRSFTVRVRRDGVPAIARTPGFSDDPSGSPNLVRDGLFMGFGGGRITIPPGALPLNPEGTGAYRVEVQNLPSEIESFDEDQFFGGRIFSLQITPEPDELLKPITLDLPFDPAAHRNTPDFGLFDESSDLFWPFESEVDAEAGRIRFQIPAGRYDSAAGSRAPTAMDAPGIEWAPAAPLPPLRLNQMFRHFGFFSRKYTHSTTHDPDRYFHVDYINDSASKHHISNAAADEILDILLQARQVLMSATLREPTFMVHVHVRDYGHPGTYQGATERRLFGLGNPVIYYNSQIVPERAKFRSTVAHELVHVFQRIVTNTWVTKWIDEATAEWGAFATVGADDFLLYAMERSVPWIKSFPTGFYLGMDEEESYAAGAFAIWLAWHYDAGVIGDIYDLLMREPTMWYDSLGTFGEVTGDVFPSMYAQFARDFWSQAYSPVDRLNLDGALQSSTQQPVTRILLDADGALVDQQRPARSSIRQGVDTEDAFLGAALDRDLVARLTVGADKGDVHVLKDPVCNTIPPVAFTQAAWLKADTPNRLLGKVGESLCYQVILVNWSASQARMVVEIVAPTITSLFPVQGSNAGGYQLFIDGRGFGATTGTVAIGGFALTPTSWNDTTIKVTMPDMGSAMGPWNVVVNTAEWAATNTKPFTFVGRPDYRR